MGKIRLATIFGLVIFMALGTYAGADTVGTVNSPLYTTTAMTGFQTFGDMMDGMSVTAYFVGGVSQTLLWADTGPNSGGVSGTGWSLAESGDTFTSNWTLSANVQITRIFIDARTGQTVFDIITDPDLTPGSARGGEFVRTGTIDGTLAVNATYAGPLAIIGDPSSPYGDLFTSLDLTFFTVAGAPSVFTGTMTFKADTDNATTQIVPGEVPEPATMLLLGSGLVGLAGYARKRMKK